MSIDDLIRPELEPMRPYAPGLRASEVREKAGVDRVVKLSSNEHPYGPVPAAVAAMRAVATRLNRYPDGSCRALREKIAAHLGAETRHVAVSSGSNELLRLVAQAVLRPGDEVVYAWPSFVVYPMVCGLFGATPIQVPLDQDERHDLPAMLAAITERTRIVFLCNPNNPTGTIFRRDELEAFLERVPGHVLVVLDEAYFEFATDPDYPDGLRYFDGTRPLAVMRTFSKMYSLAGLRVGYGVMPEALVSAVDKVREPFNVNTMAQIAAYHSLDDAAEVSRRREENRVEKQRLYECFDRLGVRYVPSEANFVYLKTDRPTEAFDTLLAEGVIARGFGNAPALRLTVGSPADNALVRDAFERAVAKSGGF